jgi:protein FRA10AC1
MVAQYHQHLFREFALADLSVPGRIGLRWRTKEEVFSGRGERSCGNKRCRNNSDGADDLATLEVPFSYEEHGERKKELVKLRVCKKCRPLLNHSTANEDSQSGVTPGENELEEDEDFGGNSPESAKKKRRKSKHSKRRYKYENKRRRRDKT